MVFCSPYRWALVIGARQLLAFLIANARIPLMLTAEFRQNPKNENGEIKRTVQIFACVIGSPDIVLPPFRAQSELDGILDKGANKSPVRCDKLFGANFDALTMPGSQLGERIGGVLVYVLQGMNGQTKNTLLPLNQWRDQHLGKPCFILSPADSLQEIMNAGFDQVMDLSEPKEQQVQFVQKLLESVPKQ